MDTCGLGWGPLLLLETGIRSLKGSPVCGSLPADVYGLWQGPSITLLLVVGLLCDILNGFGCSGRWSPEKVCACVGSLAVDDNGLWRGPLLERM